MRVTLRLLLPLLLISASCTVARQTIGRQLPAALDDLQIGISTKADALALLGPPASVRRQFDGDLLFYRRDVVNSWGILLVPLLPIYSHWEGEASSDILALLFDHRGVLAGIGLTRDIDP